MAILDRFEGQGERLGVKGGVEDLIRMREEELALELEEEVA
jgi:hypothetical protein